MQFSSSIAASLILVLAVATPCVADAPGTPNYERADVIGPHKIRMSWRDTAGGGFRSFPVVIFEVEGGVPEASACAELGNRMHVPNLTEFCKADPSSGLNSNLLLLPHHSDRPCAARFFSA
jgi:hypothetical protein